MSDLLGRPVVVYPFRCRGCLERLVAWLRRWLVRLALVGLGFLAGCTYRMVIHG